MDEHEDGHPNVVTPELLAETEGLLGMRVVSSAGIPPGAVLLAPARRVDETDDEYAGRCAVVKNLAVDAVPGWGVYR